MRVVGGRAALLAAVLAVALPAAGVASLEPQAIQDRYRALLGQLAAGEESAALEALLRLEWDAVAGDRLPEAVGEDPGRAVGPIHPGEVERLWRAKLAVVRDLLGAGDPGLLVPITRLHERAYLAHRRVGSPQLATHSRLMAAELAQFYGQRAADAAGRATAARLLASLAGHLQGNMILSGAADLFAAALDLEGGNAAALLGLGTVHEKAGQYRQAVRYLERLAASAPDFPEGRLRLAINQGRLGERAAAERLLAALVREPATEPWVGVLARQELARLRYERGDLAAAISVLEGGLRTAPESSALAVFLAFLYERSNQPRKAAEALPAPPDLVFAGDGTAPRSHYNHWPFELVERERRELDAEAPARLATLARALGGSLFSTPDGVSLDPGRGR